MKIDIYKDFEYEAYPKKLDIHWRETKSGSLYKYYRRSRYAYCNKTYKEIKRFIINHLGKTFDSTYSKFCDKYKADKVMGKCPVTNRQLFRQMFYSKHKHSVSLFIINDKGIICKNLKSLYWKTSKKYDYIIVRAKYLKPYFTYSPNIININKTKQLIINTIGHWYLEELLNNPKETVDKYITEKELLLSKLVEFRFINIFSYEVFKEFYVNSEQILFKKIYKGTSEYYKYLKRRKHKKDYSSFDFTLSKNKTRKVRNRGQMHPRSIRS